MINPSLTVVSRSTLADVGKILTQLDQLALTMAETFRDGLSPVLTCGEAETLAKTLAVAGHQDVAARIIASHADHDTDGDSHADWTEEDADQEVAAWEKPVRREGTDMPDTVVIKYSIDVDDRLSWGEITVPYFLSAEPSLAVALYLFGHREAESLVQTAEVQG